MTRKVDGRRNNRPPSESQFKSGQSGNPRGRPKKRPREFSEDQLLRDILLIADMKVNVDLGRGKKEYTLQEAMLLRMFTKAAGGDNGMIKAAIPLLETAYLRNQSNNRVVFDKLRRYRDMLSDQPDVRDEPAYLEMIDHIRSYTKPQ